MSKLSIVFTLLLVLGLIPGPSFSVDYVPFYIDFLEPGNPGGWGTSLKTWDEEWTMMVGEEGEMDVWINHSWCTGIFIAASFWLFYDPSSISIQTFEIYDGINGPPGPYDPTMTNIFPDFGGPGTYFVHCGNLDSVVFDTDGDVIIAKIRFRSESEICSDTSITLTAYPYYFFDCVHDPVIFEEEPSVFIIHQVNENDIDCDGVVNEEDNCPNDFNPDQEDTYPPGSNGCGDACECEADMNSDYNVDAYDNIMFNADFGRNIYNNPCTNENPCNADFNCDSNVDSYDSVKFNEDFGRNIYNNPCPLCPTEPWCVYE